MFPFSDFLDLVSDTVCSGPEKSGLLMKRMSELSCLITDNLQSFHMQSMLNAWTKLAKILTSHVKQNFDMDPNRECLSVFENLYLAVQNTVKHEVECSAETLLCGVFGTAVLPETLLCVNFYLNCLAYVISIYSFGSIHEDGICSDTFGEFNALGEAATFVHIIKIINGKLKSVEQTGETRSMFLSLSVVLNDIHLRVFKGAFSMKEVCHNAANTFIKILEFVQKNISGPYDDELLFGCEDLLITLLSGCSRRPSKLFLATCALWMKTFAEAKTLNYSPKLKQVMLPLVNRRMIHAPDLSKNCFDEASGLHDNDASVSMSYFKSSTTACNKDSMQSPNVINMENNEKKNTSSSNECNTSQSQSHFKSSTTACIKDSMQSPNVINMENNEMKNTSSSNECNTSQSQVGNKRKRSLRCSDPMECSKAKVARKGKSPTKFVESTAIQNSSMNEVTPRRRSTSLTKKSCLIGLLDDDSVEYVPVSTDSGKKMKLTDHQREIFSEKREWMPFLDDDSQQSAVISHLPIGFDTDSSQIPLVFFRGFVCCMINDMIRKGLVKIVSDITKSTTIVSTVDHAKDNTCLVNAEKEIVRAHGLDSTEEKSVVVNELKSPKKKSKVKLNFDQAEENKSLYEPLNDESVQKSPGCSESGLSDDLKLTRSGRTRHKKTPIKYVGAIKKSVTKNMKTVEEVLQLQSKSTYASPIPLNEVEYITNESQNDPEMDKSSSLVKGDSSVTTSDLLTSNAIEDALIVEDTFNSKTEEEVDTKDSSINAVKTPERHNGISGQMSDILTAPVIQRIGTPGILKKVNSPSTAEKKLRRVHFGESIENEISVSAPTASGGVNRTIVADEQISSSPRISKQSTTKIPFVHMHRFGEQELGPSSPTSDVTMSPMKLETTSSNSIDDEPIFPRLADCEESIGRVVGKLLSISTANGALTARKSLEAKGIIQIRHLATMSRREVLMLNIKKPRIDTVIRALSQFARDYSKPGPTYSHDNTSLLDEKSTSINTVETVAPIDNTKEINPYSVEQQQSDYVSNLSVSDTEHSDQDSENSEKVEDLSDKPKVTLSDVVIEKNQRWKTVHEAFQCAASVAGDDENVDFAKLKRCALNTAKNLLDFIEWCEEANACTH
ncbi:hypothetical protein DICVIV_04942 [Dictyocaulus viviparus]|uniref:Uncharacterized protein n=1 Tax=Dictyocaulus viviparus TaxID=29172 RepID=A0A0D8XW97_DICVI|nr:hypothetical protein DICVIV_04942 [Dictyocaulus viviparus]